MPPPGPGRRSPAVLAVTAAVVGVATAAAVALDRYAEEQRRRDAAAGRPPPDPARMTPPDLSIWQARPLAVGDTAPGFRLPDARDGRVRGLDEFRGRPAVLLFGSYGCGAFCRELGELVGLHDRYRGRAGFVFIAVRDAGHPDPVASPPPGRPLPGEPDRDARVRLTREGADHLRLPFAVLVDADGAAEAAYDAFPKRLVVVGADGRVVYDGGRGAAGGPSRWDLGAVDRHLRSALGGAPAA
ncbi:MAG: peroxiredoxin family protein, partial [Gemmataceae bacterium]|nr:peroxiredoxin family protein [Gemmataceae bacterium]